MVRPGALIIMVSCANLPTAAGARMQKVFSLALWLVVSLEGAVLVAYSPRSWLCTNTSLDNVVWNPKTGKILVDFLAGQHAELWVIDGDTPERPNRFQFVN